MTTFLHTRWAWRSERGGASARTWPTNSPPRSKPRPARVFFVLRMTLTTDIHTDLLTPLGA